MPVKKNIHTQNKLEKIVVNIGVGKLRNQSQFEEKILPEIISELAMITGQKPATRAAKKSIAGFKTRTGDIVGLQVTLRRRRMLDFLNRLVRIVLPRVKDFRGIDLKNVDEHGQLNIGFREQYVFPEIVIEKSRISFGLQVTLVTMIKNRESAIDFYRLVGAPLKHQK
ncbi:MAG: 50S ribosomal protein L5 [Patescibacteria group bacterium]|nr:50S ribosomal protein L5 [Patescibacteria group bacterium]